jgi:hypothetical protein
MAQKTYKFKSVDGKEIAKTLSRPFNARLVAFASELGIKSYSDIQTPDGQLQYGVSLLNIGLDIEKIKRMLAICLAETVEDIDFNPDTFDTAISDEVFQDFFGYRSAMYQKRAFTLPPTN